MRTAFASASADYSDDSDAGHKLELIHSSACEDDRKLGKIEENTNWLIKVPHLCVNIELMSLTF